MYVQYVCMYVCMYVLSYYFLYVCMYVCMLCRVPERSYSEPQRWRGGLEGGCRRVERREKAYLRREGEVGAGEDTGTPLHMYVCMYVCMERYYKKIQLLLRCKLSATKRSISDLWLRWTTLSWTYFLRLLPYWYIHTYIHTYYLVPTYIHTCLQCAYK